MFAMANPDPEIRPELIQDVAAVIATGRSDFPNQINNVLAFPGVFRGALDAGARKITENMKVAAAGAIAEAVRPEDLRADNIIPSVFDPEVVVVGRPGLRGRRPRRRRLPFLSATGTHDPVTAGVGEQATDDRRGATAPARRRTSSDDAARPLVRRPLARRRGRRCTCWRPSPAWIVRFVQDDAFITYRYARNLARGEGLVFNPGERVEGYTNFLWTVMHWLPERLRVVHAGVQPGRRHRPDGRDGRGDAATRPPPVRAASRSRSWSR